MSNPGLTVRTIDPDSADPALVDGWFQAMRRAFHEGRGPDTARQRWLDHVRTDHLTLRGVWEEQPAVGNGTIPVATFSSWDKSINVGGAVLPVHQISDVTVSPTHRRRGLMRQLMTADLDDAARLGVPLAALTASEGSIYGRFGFGPATFARHVEVDVGPRFRLRDDDAIRRDGTMTLLEPDEAWPTVAAIVSKVHGNTRGSVELPQFYEPWLSSQWDFDNHAPETRQRTAIHVDRDGNPDGYVIYKTETKNDAGVRFARVVDLAAVRPTAYLALWQFLASIDLVDRVTWVKAPVDDPLDWALVEPFVVNTVKVEDFLWVRVLDVEAALQARPWGADGALVLGVSDPLDHADGRWLITTRAGSASVESTDQSPDIELTADTLGALYLGGVEVRTLADAGRLTGNTDALARFQAMASAGPRPHCTTGF